MARRPKAERIHLEIWPDTVLFVGRLGDVVPHRIQCGALIVGLEGSFLVRAQDERRWQETRVAIVRADCEYAARCLDTLIGLYYAFPGTGLGPFRQRFASWKGDGTGIYTDEHLKTAAIELRDYVAPQMRALFQRAKGGASVLPGPRLDLHPALLLKSVDAADEDPMDCGRAQHPLLSVKHGRTRLFADYLSDELREPGASKLPETRAQAGTGLTRPEADKMCRDYLGIRLHTYTMYQRFRHATQCVANGWSVSLAGLHAGFKSRTYLSTAFPKTFGIPVRYLMRQEARLIFHPRFIWNARTPQARQGLGV